MPKKVKKTVADPRVKEQLEAEDIPYEISDDGVYVIAKQDEEDEEPTLVFINSETNVICGQEWREISSIAMIHDGPLELHMTHDLLFRNALTLFGSWRLVPADSNQLLVVFHTRVATDCKPEVLSEYLVEVVAEVEEFLDNFDWGDDDTDDDEPQLISLV